MGVSFDTPPAVKLERLEALVGEHLRSQRETVIRQAKRYETRLMSAYESLGIVEESATEA